MSASRISTPHRRSLAAPLNRTAWAAQALLLSLAAGGLHAQTAQTSESASAQKAEAAVKSLDEVQVQDTAIRPEATAGSSVTLKREDIEKTGATGMADVVRYQPLVEAPGTTQGVSRGASRYDRAGTTGYNIRGVEGNRVGLDVDGIEMPDAVDRAASSGGRINTGTFGMGRDFIDPDIYTAVDIQSGTSGAARPAGGIGGSVSFRSKSPEDYVNAGKPHYFGGKLGYADANEAWTKEITAAGMNANGLSGIVSYVRRDGKQTQNNSISGIESNPSDWNTNALLLKGVFKANAEHRVQATADIYRKNDDSAFNSWNNTGSAITGNSVQDSKTKRDTLSLSHLWTPASRVVDLLETKIHHQNTDMKDITTTVAATAAATRSVELSQNKTRQTGFETRAEKYIGNHALSFGLNASRTATSHPLQTLVGSSEMQQPYPDTRTTKFGAFVQDRMQFGRLSLTPGLRIDRVDSGIRASSYSTSYVPSSEAATMYGSVPDITIASPSLAASFEVKPQLHAYAQWRHSGRAPTASEFYGYWNHPRPASYVALVGNPNLKNERSNAFEFGLKGKLAEGVQTNWSVFYTRYKNFISYSRYTRASYPEQFINLRNQLSIIYKAENRDSANIYGTEFVTKIDHGAFSPAVRGLYSTWGLGYSQGKSKSRYAGDKWVKLDSVQPPKAIIGVGFDDPGKTWGFNLVGTFVKSKQAEATNRMSFSNNPGAQLTDSTVQLFRVPGYARFDVSGYWKIGKHARLNAGIYNLADKRYWNYSSVRNLQTNTAQDRRDIELSTAPGRTYAVSLSVDF